MRRITNASTAAAPPLEPCARSARRQAGPVLARLAAGAGGPRPPLTGSVECDLAVVGGGYHGLWTALLAKERDPVARGRRARGRPHRLAGVGPQRRLLHGDAHARAPPTTTRAGPTTSNVSRRRHHQPAGDSAPTSAPAIDCDWQDRRATSPPRPGRSRTCTRCRAGDRARTPEWLDGDAIRAEVDSPTSWRRSGTATERWSTPRAWRGAWRASAARRACASTKARRRRRSRRAGAGADCARRRAPSRAAQAVLATNAFPALIRAPPLLHGAGVRLRAHDRATQRRAARVDRLEEPAGAGRRRRLLPLLPHQRGPAHPLGRLGRHLPLAQPHPPRVRRPAATFAKLAGHFFAMFPQLQGLRFTHGWGGVIDVCSRFTRSTARRWTAASAYGLGYTGPGVAAGALRRERRLDLLAGEKTELTAMAIVRTQAAAVAARAAAVPDDRGHAAVDGARGAARRPAQPLAAALDHFGLGFDS